MCFHCQDWLHILNITGDNGVYPPPHMQLGLFIYRTIEYYWAVLGVGMKAEVTDVTAGDVTYEQVTVSVDTF